MLYPNGKIENLALINYYFHEIVNLKVNIDLIHLLAEGTANQKCDYLGSISILGFIFPLNHLRPLLCLG